MANSKLYSYFNHWVGVLERREILTQKNFRELLCRRYNSLIHQAFNTWRTGHAHGGKAKEMMRNAELVEESGGLQGDNLELEKEIKTEDNRQDKTKRTSLRRSCNIYNKRMMIHGFRTWANRVRDQREKEMKA